MKLSGASLAAIVLLLILLPSDSEATISCSDVIKDLKPCLSYLTSSGSTQQPPQTCCSGVQALSAAATSSEDKKAACNCMKSTAKSLKINSKSAQALPGSCGISLPITVSPNADCSKVG